MTNDFRLLSSNIASSRKPAELTRLAQDGGNLEAKSGEKDPAYNYEVEEQ